MIIYHKDDADGWCSAAIAWHAAPRNEGDPSVGVPAERIVGMSYGDPIPWDEIAKEREVVMLDFSFQPWSEMERLRDTRIPVLWIDHHATAIENWRGRDPSSWGHWVADLNTQYAACELTWRHYHPGAVEPEAVHLCGRYDVWDHDAGSDIVAFQSGLRLCDGYAKPWSSLWKELVTGTGNHTLVADILVDGRVVEKYRGNQAEMLMKSAFEARLSGLRLLCVNAPQINSLTFASLWDPARWDAMCAFSCRGDGWTLSLYTDKEGIDVGAVCKALGGGGHVKAAGFQPTTKQIAALLAGSRKL